MPLFESHDERVAGDAFKVCAAPLCDPPDLSRSEASDTVLDWARQGSPASSGNLCQMRVALPVTNALLTMLMLIDLQELVTRAKDYQVRCCICGSHWHAFSHDNTYPVCTPSLVKLPS